MEIFERALEVGAIAPAGLLLPDINDILKWIERGYLTGYTEGYRNNRPGADTAGLVDVPDPKPR